MKRRSENEVVSRLAWRVDAFCRAAGISRTTFYELIKQKKLKTILLGRRRLVPDAEVRRILSEGA
jgi:excisionase family DNA binding protein